MEIAIDNGLSMEQLQKANPGIDLELLLVGDTLVIPPADEAGFASFMNTVYAEHMQITDSRCYAMVDQSAACFLTIRNTGTDPVFNIQLSASIVDAGGGKSTSEGDFSLLQLLPGEEIPVYTYAAGPLAQPCSISGVIDDLSSDPNMPAAFRIDEERMEWTVQISADGLSADISFLFDAALADEREAENVNILAAAYNASGEVIGERSMIGSFYPDLSVTVYSLSGTIDSVKTWVELY